MARKLIGEILRENGKISEEQIAKALRQQEERESDKALGHILFDMGLVDDDDVLTAWSQQLGTEVVNLETAEIAPAALKKVPREIAEKHHVFPLRCDDGTLVLAMCDPLDDEAIDEIRQHSGCKIEPVVGSALGITHAIARYYD